MLFIQRLLLLYLLVLATVVWGGDKAHVLLLNSYHYGMDWTDGETVGVREVLESSGLPVELHLEYMDSKRLADATHFDNLRQLLQYKYRNTRFAAILATDNDAFNFLRQHRDTLFKGVPVVFTGVNFFREDMLTGLTGFTGVAETFEGGQTLAAMLRLHPGVRRIVVILDATTTGQAIRKELEPMLAPYAGQVKFEFRDQQTLAELRSGLAALGRQDLVLLLPYARDRAGAYISFGDLAAMVSRHSPVPVYGTWDFYMGYGIVGGRLTNAAAQGRAGAELLLRVLRGEDPGRIAVTRVAPSEFQFDSRQLRRHGIAVADLPEDSRVLFQSWFETYRSRVLLSAVFAGLSLLLLWSWWRSQRLRRRSDKALRINKERYRLILQHSPIGILQFDRNLAITFCNDRLARILHAPREQLLGLDMNRLKDACVLPALREAIAGREGRYEGEYHATLSGRQIWITLSCAPLRDEQGEIEGGIAIVEDISERKRAEDLHQTAAHYARSLIEASLDPLVTISAEGKITDVNTATEHATGVARQHLIGSDFADYFTAPEQAREGYQRVFSEGFVTDYPLAIRHVSGRVTEVLYNASVYRDGGGQVLGIFAAARDITERKRAELELAEYRQHLEVLVQQRTAALLETEARASHILLSSADGLYGTDADGCLTFINPAGCAMLGYVADEIIGRPVHALFHGRKPDGTPYPASECPSHNALRLGREVRVDNEVYWHADGHAVPVMYAVHPVVRDRVITGAVTSFVDMSVQRAAAQAREQALIVAENLARTRSQFLANMSHEIRTPLNGVLGFAQIGYRHYQDAEKARHAFGHIINSGKLLLGVINDILDFSKIEAGKLGIEQVETRPAEVIDHAVELVRERALAKGLELRVELAAELPRLCRSDPLRLGQILLNLLSNAVKFSETGRVTLAATRRGERLVFRLTDTGIGMDPAQMARLFNPFQQADGSTTRRFGGTGLGLAISKRMLELMGGSIRVESTPGVGSTFEFEIPCEELSEADAPAEAPPAPVVVRPLAGLRILVAEDNLINQMVLEETLRDAGAQVILAENGREAVDHIVHAGRASVDLVLMDIQMPVMDGYEATLRILEMAPDLPVIGQTAHAYGDDRERCFVAGMVAHIAKPIDPDALVRLLLEHAPQPAGR